MRKHNSPVNNRSGMNQQNSSKQSSQGNEGKKKNERKGSVNTNPSHEVPNSFPGFSDSKPIGKKPRLDEDSEQADLKTQQESSETRNSEQESSEYNPKPSLIAFRKILRHLGKKAYQCTMVEDDLANLKTAYKIGMKTILVSRQNKKTIFVNKRITKITQLTQSS